MAEAALTAYAVTRDEKYLVTFCALASGSTDKTACDSRWQMLVEALVATACTPRTSTEIKARSSTLAYLWTEFHSLELNQALHRSPQTGIRADA